jgi:NADH:ubiquinone oxidoreductase subunit E
MDEKVKVKICTGTTCYVMGASDILTLADDKSETFLDKVEVLGVPCLDLCMHSEKGRAPFVRINDDIISEANLEKVKSEIKKIIGSW